MCREAAIAGRPTTTTPLQKLLKRFRPSSCATTSAARHLEWTMAVLASADGGAGEEPLDGSESASASTDAASGLLPLALTGWSSTDCGSVRTLVAMLQGHSYVQQTRCNLLEFPRAVKCELTALECSWGAPFSRGWLHVVLHVCNSQQETVQYCTSIEFENCEDRVLEP